MKKINKENKIKKTKKAEEVEKTTADISLPAKTPAPGEYRNAVLYSAALTAGVAGAALILPLKAVFAEDRISLSSFTFSIRCEKTEKGFSAGIYPPDMSVSDVQNLARTLYSYYLEKRNSALSGK